MKTIRRLAIALALLVPVVALATPAVHAPCCDSSCCPSCPLCPSGLHK